MSQPLRILMISHHREFKFGARPGAIAQHLVKRGHQATVLITADRARGKITETDWNGVHLVRTPDLLWGKLRSGWDPWNTLNRVAYLSRDKGPYDFVYCFETRPATIYPALFYCRRHRLPLLTDWNDWWGRGGLIEVMRPRWYRALFGGIETYYEEAFRTRGVGLSVISTALAQRAVGLGVPADRICYLPGGTMPDLLPCRSKEECRARVGLPLAEPVLGFASMDSHLDLELVLHTLSLVAQQYPTVKLIITGSTGRAVTELIKQWGMERHVILTGYLSLADLSWYLGCADLYLLPFPNTIYNVGRWPNKIGTYMSLGRPTVCNPVGDMKALFEQHHIGLLAAWDPADFAAQVNALLAQPALAAELGANAWQAATGQYDWRTLITTLEQFCYRVLGEVTDRG